MSRRKNRWRRRRRPGTAIAVIPRRPYPESYGTAVQGHVALLGDSILDNWAYTNGAPDVAQRLHSMLPGWKVSLLARDGATTRSLDWQVKHIPADTTALIVSIGGNDALGEYKILSDPQLYTTRETLENLSLMAWLFSISYQSAMAPLVALGIPLTVCTIYDCDFAEGERDAALPALALFNDVILRFAFTNDLPVLDLRTVCTTPEDYELGIEPSATGGAKIARAISSVIVPEWQDADLIS